MAGAIVSWAALPALAALVVVGYLYRLNRAMSTVPEDIQREAEKHAWTDAELQKTYDRIVASPLDSRPLLPPRLERRYVVVGGSGTLAPRTCRIH
jgi:hypothetical protein